MTSIRGEDDPSASAQEKELTKDMIGFTERLVRSVRAAIEFEANLSKSRRAEAVAIGALLGRAPPD